MDVFLLRTVNTNRTEISSFCCVIIVEAAAKKIFSLFEQPWNHKKLLAPVHAKSLLS